MIKNYLKLLVALVFATNLIAQNVPSYLPKDGLVGWWPFNGNANDESGNGNNGTVNGATLTNDRNGNANSAYSFNKNYIKINNNSVFNFTNTLSVNIWYRISSETTQSTNNMFFIAKHLNASTNSSYCVYNENKCGPTVYLTEDNSNVSFLRDIKFCDTNLWHMITMTLNANKLKMYLDGYLTLEKVINNNIKQTELPLIFGGCSNSIQKDDIIGRMIGKLDDIAIYNRALSDQEVKQLYEGCPKETATSNSFNSYVFTNNSSVKLTATPSGGTFSGEAVTNNAFNPSKAKLGKNQVKYNFKNSTGCADSTNFEMIMVDTLGNKCSTYDTLKIKVQLTTGINAGQLTSMNVYPNPTSDVVIIETNDVAALNGYSYKMVDLQGKQVYKELVTTSKTEISLKSIGAKGVYILHVLDAQGVSIENKKIVLE